MPTTAASIETKVPVTKQPDGTLAIDKDKIIAREELKSIDPKPPSVAPKQVIDKTNKTLDRMQDPSATKEDLNEYLENFKQVQEEDARLIGEGRIEDALKISISGLDIVRDYDYTELKMEYYIQLGMLEDHNGNLNEEGMWYEKALILPDSKKNENILKIKNNIILLKIKQIELKEYKNIIKIR